VGATHSYRVGPIAYTLYAALDDSEYWNLAADFEPSKHEDGGQRNNSDSSFYQIGAALRWHVNDVQSLETRAYLVDGEHGVPPSVHERYPRFWRFNNWQTQSVQVVHRGAYLGEKLQISEQFYLRAYSNTVDAYDDDSYASQVIPGSFHSIFRDTVLGLTTQTQYSSTIDAFDLALLRLWATAQLDQHREEGSDANLSPELSRVLLSFAPDVELYWRRAWRLVAGVQIDTEIPLALAGEHENPQCALGPLLSLRFDPVPALMLKVSVARRTRLPTLKERFSRQNGFRIPNPDLGAEQAWHFAVDSQWQVHKKMRIEASVFDAEVSDLIERMHLGGGVDQIVNLGKARMFGAELRSTVAPFHWLDAELSYQWLWARQLDVDEAEALLEYRPEHSARARLHLQPLSQLGFATSLRVESQRDYVDPDSRQWQQLPPTAVVDMRVDWIPQPDLSVFARIDNALDLNYQNEYGFYAPGRQYWLGVRLQIEAEPKK
jgi:iron complex outermembrane receptor protein